MAYQRRASLPSHPTDAHAANVRAEREGVSADFTDACAERNAVSKWKPPYRIETESKPTKPGCWNVNAVRVIGSDEKPVGEYEYNYSGRPPFFPFELDGQWYALYSRDYTASRIMRLPSCEDVWGEERASCGFCPVEFYVPSYQNINFGGDRTGKCTGTWNEDPDDFQEPHYDKENDWTVTPVIFHDVGFVSGCIWGDDSTWKVRFFDLAGLKDGVVVYDDRFGYLELHGSLSLKDSVRVARHNDRVRTRISIVTPVSFSFDGSRIEDNDE